MVRTSRLLVDGLLVAARGSCLSSFIGIVGSSEGIRDILEDEGDEQHKEDEHNGEVDTEKDDDDD